MDTNTGTECTNDTICRLDEEYVKWYVVNYDIETGYIRFQIDLKKLRREKAIRELNKLLEEWS